MSHSLNIHIYTYIQYKTYLYTHLIQERLNKSIFKAF